jgi:hypothetical protein
MPHALQLKMSFFVSMQRSPQHSSPTGHVVWPVPVHALVHEPPGLQTCGAMQPLCGVHSTH